LNSPYGDAIVNDDLRYVRWGDPDAGSPSVLTAMEFTDLARSPKLFARKFDTSVDSTVLDMIDAHVNA